MLTLRAHGEQSEMRFCDDKQLSQPILRMTCEAKNQLRVILINYGFPEEALMPLNYNYHGPDAKLDVVGNRYSFDISAAGKPVLLILIY